MSVDRKKIKKHEELLNPSNILEIGMGFWKSKVLLTAAQFNLFTYLESGKKSANDIKEHLNLHGRGLYDFLDALTTMGILEREGILEDAYYKNSPEASEFLVVDKPSYLGGLLQFSNERLYGFWGTLEDGLKTGLPQNETKNSVFTIFNTLFNDREKLQIYHDAMASLHGASFNILVNRFDFKPYMSMCDIGGSTGLLAWTIKQKYPHIECSTFDLDYVEPVVVNFLEKHDALTKVNIINGDFFVDSFPNVDILTMGMILHDWGEFEKIMLLKKVYNALSDNGIFIAIESFIDNDRKKNLHGLLMSLNMLIETPRGYDFTPNQFDKWAKDVGFQKTEFISLAGPTSAIIAYK